MPLRPTPDNTFPWPNGARCAVSVNFDCDADSPAHELDPRDPGKLATMVSWLQYDQVAVPRIVKLFESLGIKQTFFVPAWCLEQYPQAFEPVVESGHEIAHHAYLHERPTYQTPEAERHWFERSIEVIERFQGRKPTGYRAPWADLSTQTLELCAEHGLIYDSSLLTDTYPYTLNTARGSLVELPTDYFVLEDWSQFANLGGAFGYMMQPRAPEDAARVYKAEFEAIYEMGGLFILIFHPMVSGRPGRLKMVAEVIEHIASKGDVWIAPMEDIARHAIAVRDGGYELNELDWPYYPSGAVPELTPGTVPDNLMLRFPAQA